MTSHTTTFERFAAEQLLEQREALARTWLERLPLALHGQPLPDPHPGLLRGLADLPFDTDECALSDDPEMLRALRILAHHRHLQGSEVRELIREFHHLARVLDEACLRWVGACAEPPDPAAVVRVVGRLNRAPILMGEICAGIFLELEQAERAQLAEQVGSFTDMLVHELRNPLGAAETAAMILESDEMVPTAEERRRFATLIQRSLRRASSMVEDARTVACARAADAEGCRWVPLAHALTAVLAETGESAIAMGVRLEVDEPIPAVRVDAARMTLVLRNLIGNAVKYSDPGAPDRWVRVRFPASENGSAGWALVVEDNGLGIDAEHHARIFERAVRVHPGRAGGAGLGLAIVREVVRQLEGAIAVESEPGRGSCFRLSFPDSRPGQEDE